MVFSFVPCFEVHTALEGGCAAPAAGRGRGHVSTSCIRWLDIQHPPLEGIFQKRPLLKGLSGVEKKVPLVRPPPLSTGGFLYHENEMPSRGIGV